MTDPTSRGLLSAIRRGRDHARDLRQATPQLLREEKVDTAWLRAELDRARLVLEGSLLLRERARLAARTVAHLAEGPLGDEARNVLERLRGIEAARFATIRDDLAAGTYRPEDLKAELDNRPVLEHDLYIARLLGIHDPPGESKAWDADHSPYLASPYALIAPHLEHLGPDDVVFDLGSGLGKVPFLVRWMTGARSIGVEYDPALHAAAVRARDALGLQVELIEADARDVDYSDGTFFYFFEPFRGALLRDVLDRIHVAAQQHPIRLVLNQATEVELALPRWLREIDGPRLRFGSGHTRFFEA